MDGEPASPSSTSVSSCASPYALHHPAAGHVAVGAVKDCAEARLDCALTATAGDVSGNAAQPVSTATIAAASAKPAAAEYSSLVMSDNLYFVAWPQLSFKKSRASTASS